MGPPVRRFPAVWHWRLVSEKMGGGAALLQLLPRLSFAAAMSHESKVSASAPTASPSRVPALVVAAVPAGGARTGGAAASTVAADGGAASAASSEAREREEKDSDVAAKPGGLLPPGTFQYCAKTLDGRTLILFATPATTTWDAAVDICRLVPEDYRHPDKRADHLCRQAAVRWGPPV